MAWLIACEESQTVCKAFRDVGVEAFSCDLLPTRGNPEWHIQGDAIDVAYSQSWDGMVAHPVCQYLANSGVWKLHRDPSRWEHMRAGANFFKTLLDAPIQMKAIENPIMHKYAKEIIGRGQDQVIQPWMFGHAESKATCLLLENLPLLVPTDNVKAEVDKLSKQERQKIYWLSPSPTRARDRSVTLTGIAQAMATQWGLQ